ncbi:hypothetical protein GCM10009801_03830 [Streptomyces albiaxialis]|uniref:DUF998 domain-containing protein n=1 Tax=Streptomyces albiaxialis TaxID=329523 RepID=A0ABP5H322_9ACTN
MGLGNLGLLCAARAPRGRALALALGAAATTAAALFFTQHDPLGLGPGLLERFAAYGTGVWTCVQGAALLRATRATRRRPSGAR